MNVQISSNDFKIPGPELVIVKFNGKDIPYPADRTIAQLFEDLKAGGVQPDGKSGIVARQDSPPANSIKNTTIEKRDLVTCLEDSIPSDGNPQELFKGRVYMVLDVIEGGKFFEIIDQNSETKRRILIPSEKVWLFQKSGPMEQKVQNVERLAPCRNCSEETVYIKAGDEFIGECSFGHISMLEAS